MTAEDTPKTDTDSNALRRLGVPDDSPLATGSYVGQYAGYIHSTPDIDLEPVTGDHDAAAFAHEYQTGSSVLAHGDKKGHVIKTEGLRAYVELKDGKRLWVSRDDLSLISPPSNMPVLPSWIAVGVEAQNDMWQRGKITAIHWTPKDNRWLITFKSATGIEDLIVDEIKPLPIEDTDPDDTPLPTLYDIGSDALYQGERVRIIATDLFVRRKVRYMDLADLPEHWVDVGALMPADTFQIPSHDQAPTIASHPADPLTIDQASDIGLREMALAAEKDQQIKDLNLSLGKLQDRIDDLDTMLSWAREDRDMARERVVRLEAAYIKANARVAQLEAAADEAADEESYLERLVMESNAELKAEIQALKAKQPETPVRRKIETVTFDDIDDDILAGHINGGWRVVFEAAYTLPSYGKEVFHMVRLERDVEDRTPPPTETHAAVTASDSDEALLPSPADDAPDTLETPSAADILFSTTSTPVIVMPITAKAIDLSKIDLSPERLAEMVDLYGPEAYGQAQDAQIVGAVKLFEQRFHERVNALKAAAPVYTWQQRRMAAGAQP